MEDRNMLLFIVVIAMSMPPTTLACAISKVDLVIILDIDSDVTGMNFQKVLDFVGNLIRSSFFDSGIFRVGLLATYRGREENWPLNKYNETSDIMDAIDQVSYPQSYFDIACTLETMRDVMFTSSHGDRDDAPNFAIIVTNDLDSAMDTCLPPHTNISSIHMYAIGIGLTDVRKLNTLASPPAPNNSFALDSYDDLKGLEQPIFTSICSGATLTKATTLVYENIDDADDLVVEPDMSELTAYINEEQRNLKYTFCVTIVAMPSTTLACAISKVDLVIILDIDSDVTGMNFQKVLDFVRNLIRSSFVDSGIVRVGLLATYRGREENWHLNKYNKTSDIMDAIDHVSYPQSYFDIACTLETMRDVMFTSRHGDRDDAPNFAIIVTNDLASAMDTCLPPHTNISSIHMYAIGIGLTEVRKLNALASPPAPNNSFALDSYDDLKGLEQTIFTSICSGATLTEATTLVYENIDDADDLVVEPDMSTNATDATSQYSEHSDDEDNLTVESGLTMAYMCEADRDSYGTLWNWTSGPSRLKQACPPDHTGDVYRVCDKDGIWHAPVYNCTADKLFNIKQRVQNGSSVRSALESLANFTQTKNYPSPTNRVGNVQTTSDVLSLIVDRIDSTEPVADGVLEDFFDVANNLMDVNATTAWGSIITETGSGVDKTLMSIDSLVEKAVKAGNNSGKNAEFAKSHFYVTIGRSNDAVREITFPDKTSNNLPQWARRSVNSIVLPKDNSTKNVFYSSIIYKDLREMLPGLSNESEVGKEELNSPVMSLTLFKKDRFPLTKPATITFQLLERGLNTPRCSFWNKGLTGWDTDGCVLASYDARSGVVVCECSHLTNFAVLMSHAAATEVHMKTLNVISILGCGTSMICLVLTFAFYLHHWKRVGSDRAILLLNLCVVLFVAYLVFLAGVDRVSNKDACTSVAVVLHFLYLSVFFIMLAKSVYLAKMLLWPMNRTPISKWCLLAAYGSAACVVAVSTGTTKLHGYGNDTTCWLSIQSGLLWAFVGPALFVIVANAVVVVIILKIKFSTAAMAKKTNQEKISSGLRTILVLLPIMGITWVLGVFSVNEDTVVFQYLFALCNSLQGLLIFIFHCLLDHKMKQQLDKSARKIKRKMHPRVLANMRSMSGTNTAMELILSSPSTSHRDVP